MTPSQIRSHGSVIDDVSGYDYKIVTIPENLGSALINQKDEAGRPIRDLSTFVEEVRDSLSYQIV